jgi:multiple antibiotic resistance protein
MDIFQSHYFPETVLALFAVMGIPTLPPVFVSATDGMEPRERRKIALQSTLAIGVTMLVSLMIGSLILQFFKINIESFNVAGSLVVSSMAWGMITGKPSALMDTHGKNPAVIPLAMPKTAGPGAIATVISLGEAHSTPVVISNMLAITVVTLIALVVMLASDPIARILGANGLNLMNRIFGLILLAIALTTIMTSFLDFFPGLGK